MPTHHTVEVKDTVPVKDTTATPKPRPKCCQDASRAIWWETKSLSMMPDAPHKPGWTGVANVSIPSRVAWFYNPTFCPFCGTKLPDSL